MVRVSLSTCPLYGVRIAFSWFSDLCVAGRVGTFAHATYGARQLSPMPGVATLKPALAAGVECWSFGRLPAYLLCSATYPELQ